MTDSPDPEPSRAELHLGRTHSQARLSARERFLELIEETASEVISDLRSEALTPFRMLKNSRGWVIADAIASQDQRTPFETIRLKAEGAQGRDELLGVLEAWQERWRLRAPWIENAALQALDQWSRQTAAEIDEKSWPAEFKQLGLLPEVGEPLSLRPYNPLRESQPAYKTEMLGVLDTYTAGIEQDARERFGAEDWPRRTSQGKRPSDQHLRWCLRYLLGETQYELSFRPEGTEPPAPPRSRSKSRRTGSVHEDAIHRGIKNAAELLGLTLP